MVRVILIGTFSPSDPEHDHDSAGGEDLRRGSGALDALIPEGQQLIPDRTRNRLVCALQTFHSPVSCSPIVAPPYVEKPHRQAPKEYRQDDGGRRPKPAIDAAMAASSQLKRRFPRLITISSRRGRLPFP